MRTFQRSSESLKCLFWARDAKYPATARRSLHAHLRCLPGSQFRLSLESKHFQVVLSMQKTSVSEENCPARFRFDELRFGSLLAQMWIKVAWFALVKIRQVQPPGFEHPLGRSLGEVREAGAQTSASAYYQAAIAVDLRSSRTAFPGVIFGRTICKIPSAKDPWAFSGLISVGKFKARKSSVLLPSL